MQKTDMYPIFTIMSFYEKGLLFEKGGRVPYDKAVAADYYKIASKSGDTRAMYRLALLEMKRSPVESADLMRKAARNGNNDAAWWLAERLFYGIVLPKDHGEAFCWLKELYLRNGLSPKAGFLMGICHYNGYGTTVNYEAAVQALFGALELSGRDRWGTPSPERTRTWKGVENVFTDSEVRTICRILGECHYYGRGVAKDYCRALKYLLLSVQDRKNMYPNKDTEYLIGTCYYFHFGTHQDISTALYWLADAEKQGSVEARRLLERRARRQEKKRTAVSL